MSEQQRETLTVEKRSRLQIAEDDWRSLLGEEKFLRVLFTMMDVAGMFTGNFQPDQRSHAFAEGRRSWGLDILRTAEKYLGPTALKRIVDAEMKTPQEAPYADRRSRNRTDELGSGDADERGEPPVRYLDY